MCYLPKSRNVITLVRRINFAYILFWFLVQLNFTQVVDKTESTNYSHIHCIVYLVIVRSSQDNYPFTSFAAPMGHANFRALSFIHIINWRDTIGYTFSTGMLKLAEWYNYTGRLCWWWCSHWNHWNKSFLNNINKSTLLKLLPPNENAFQQHIKPSSSLRTMDGL